MGKTIIEWMKLKPKVSGPQDDPLDVIVDRKPDSDDSTSHLYKPLDGSDTFQYDDQIGMTKMYLRRLSERWSFALTITFRDDIRFKYKELYLANAIKRLIDKTKGVIDYEFVSDWSKTDVFHMHGTIEVNKQSVITNVRRKLHNQFGMTKVKLIDNSERWVDYVLSQYSDTGKKGVKIDIKDIIVIHK